jgi:hypothetical protein
VAGVIVASSVVEESIHTTNAEANDIVPPQRRPRSFTFFIPHSFIFRKE